MSTCVSHLTHDTWSLLFRRNNHEQLPGAFLFLGMILFCVPMSYGLVVITGIMLLYGFFYQLPALISCVPLCRRPSAPVY